MTSFSSAYTGSGALTAPICCGCASGESVCEASSNPASAIAGRLLQAVDSASEPASPVVVAQLLDCRCVGILLEDRPN